MIVLEKNYSSNRAQVIFKVEEDEHLKRLDDFVKNYLSNYSREKIKQLIHDKNVEILNRPTKNSPHTKIFKNDQISISYHSKEVKEIDIKDLILFENEDIIAINKPSGMLVHPTGIHLFNVASVLLENHLQHKIFPIHRLDKETSGILCFAKSSQIAQKLGREFEEHRVTKKYYFIAKYQSQNFANNFIIDKNITDDSDSIISLKQKISNSTDEGKRAITHFSDIKVIDGNLHGYAYPQTGRLHQIRVHLNSIGCPILGDIIYNDEYTEYEYWDMIKNNKAPKMELYCVYMKFCDYPELSLRAEAPKFFST